MITGLIVSIIMMFVVVVGLGWSVRESLPNAYRNAGVVVMLLMFVFTVCIGGAIGQSVESHVMKNLMVRLEYIQYTPSGVLYVPQSVADSTNQIGTATAKQFKWLKK